MLKGKGLTIRRVFKRDPEAESEALLKLLTSRAAPRTIGEDADEEDEKVDAPTEVEVDGE